MPDDRRSAPGARPNPFAGTVLEPFADPPGFKPPNMRWELHKWFGRRELPDAPAPDGELVRAQLRYLSSVTSSRKTPGSSRTD